jgi:integrase/recombinase XerD
MGRPPTRKPELLIAQSAKQPAGSMRAFLGPFVQAQRTQGYAEATLRVVGYQVVNFIEWCEQRDVALAADVTKAHIERYQHMVCQLLGPGGEPISNSSIHHRLLAVRSFFAWLSRQHHILFSPAADLQLPRRAPRQLPKQILNAEQVERILALTDVETPLGLRDRAILETLYSTGLRRKELVGLAVYDVDATKGVVHVRHGKAGRQRITPIGTRALLWIQKYLHDARPALNPPTEQKALFLAAPWGSLPARPMTAHCLGAVVRDYLDRAGLPHTGSCCHVFRHAMATQMLENGADVRFLQAILGHANLETTEAYTHVAIGKLKQVHAATHPALVPDGFEHQVAQAAGEEVTAQTKAALSGAQMDTSGGRIPGYPGKAQRQRAINRRRHKPHAWTKRLVRNPKTPS